jgi:hypothetical protein
MQAKLPAVAPVHRNPVPSRTCIGFRHVVCHPLSEAGGIETIGPEKKGNRQ